MTSYVTTTVLMAAYSAALVSSMTVQDFKLPFSSFRELLQLRHYRLGTLSGSAQISYFEVRHIVTVTVCQQDPGHTCHTTD
jgi:hypothetical protein